MNVVEILNNRRARFGLLSGALLQIGLLFPSHTPAQTQQGAHANELFQKATAAMRSGQFGEAEQGFAEVVKLNPNFAEAYLNLGLSQEQQGKNADAAASFHKAAQLKPKLRGANLFLGIAEYRLNHYDGAAAALQIETTNYPKDAAGWMWLGITRLAQDRPEDSAVALDKAVELDPNNIDVLYHRGRAHLLVSRDSYTRMFKLNPNSWRVHQVLAQMDADSEHDEEAVLEYIEAIKLAPSQSGLHEELGSEYSVLVKIPEAEAAFRKELEIDPNNALARYKLGVIEVGQGNAADGKRLIMEALALKPGLANADYNLGRAEMQLGNDEAAAEDFRRALKSDSEPEIIRQAWYQLGTVLRRMKRTQEAQQAFAMYQKLKDEEEEDQRRLKTKRALRQEQIQGEQPVKAQPEAGKPQPQ
jgi:tetratricopeptide (TPR) repeat protein